MSETPAAILSLSSPELESWLAANDAPAYRRRQIWGSLARGAASFEEMRDVPKALRTALDRDFRTSSLRTVAVTQADRGLTTKTLYELDGGHTVEAVVMRYAGRSTLCISSQAGCPIGCPFCATGKFPFGRNLRSHEIEEQALDAARLLAGEGRRLSHIVFMGMGEPFANYDSVVESVRRFTDQELLGISPRRIVLSTSGLIPRITQLGEEKLPVTLAISLHAARDELRDVLVPINRKYPIAALVAASQGYAEKTGRRVSYEWVLLSGVNDTERDARELGRLLARKLAHVNLIPFNPVEDTPYRAPSRDGVRRFKELVEAQGLNVTVRDTRGRGADAACGQLHERVMRESGGGRVIAGTLYAGTSGFSYTSWKGAFYPADLPATRMLAYYATWLDGVELNGCFYRMPQEPMLVKWATGTPAGFLFCMKAHRGLTYSAEGFDRVGLARLFGERMAVLGDRLGPILLQFPPVRQRDLVLLDSLLGALGHPVASEFRHESWFHPDTYRVIREHQGALVVTDEEKWPRAPLVDLGPTAYFRLRRGYTMRTLSSWLGEVKAAVGAYDQVHVYFKHELNAPALARRMVRSIARR